MSLRCGGQAGATWAAQPANVWVGGGEWSLHALQSGTVLLTEGSGRMFRSGLLTFCCGTDARLLRTFPRLFRSSLCDCPC